MDCTVCGGDNRERARFCRHCGAALAAVSDTDEALPMAETEPEVSPPRERPVVEGEGLAVAPSVEGEAVLEEEVQPEGTEEVAPETDEAGTISSEAISEAVEVAFDEDELEVEQPALPAEDAAGGEPSETGEPEPALVTPEVGEPEAPPPLVPLEPGAVVADRYLLLETLESGDDQILYRTRDLVRCWQCGYEGNAPDEAYCAQCGVALDRKEEARLLEVRDIEASGPPGEAVIERFTSEGRSFLRLAAMAPESVPGRGEAEPAQREDGGVRLWAGQRSDTGQVRELNEDSLVVLVAVPTWESNTGPVLGLFAVADGMGGHEGGEVASKLALRVVAGETLPEQALTANLGAAAVAANDAVYLERHKRENDMGTTLTVALLRDDQVHLAHVGDSRAYRWSAAGLEQLTTDHSMVASLIASGRAEPDEIYTHPQRSVIYRSIGDRPQVEVDTATLPLATGDRLILCSDGLWEMIRDEGIADVMMLEANPQAACDLMVQRANLAGGDDNISVVVVQVEAGQMSK